VLDGRIYAVGGQHLTSSATPQNELDAYDPATDTWTTLPPLPTARSHVMDSTFVLAGRLLVASGFTTSDYSAKVEAYDPAARVWSTLTPLPVARSSAFAKPLTGQRYLYGGGGPATAWLASPSA
jgi:hypothetical protein